MPHNTNFPPPITGDPLLEHELPDNLRAGSVLKQCMCCSSWVRNVSKSQGICFSCVASDSLVIKPPSSGKAPSPSTPSNAPIPPAPHDWKIQYIITRTMGASLKFSNREAAEQAGIAESRTGNMCWLWIRRELIALEKGTVMFSSTIRLRTYANGDSYVSS